LDAPVPENLLTDLVRSIVDAYGDENIGGLDAIRANEISDCLKNVVHTLSEYENTAKNIALMTNDNIPVITNLISASDDSRVKAASTKLNELHGKLKNELSKADATIKTFRTHVEQMKKNSKIDPLTKTYNYIAYLQDMKPILRIGQERELDLCTILIEITNLSEITKQLSDEVSNKVLIYVTKILNSLIRQENRIYRYNNDTFLIVLNRSAEENLSSTEERIIGKLTKQKIVYSNQNVELVIHSGKSFHKQGDDIDSFTDRARSDKRRIVT
jgi:diguanylate cyclase